MKQETGHNPEGHNSLRRNRMFYPLLLLVIGLVVSVVSVVLTFSPVTRWIGHAITAVVGLILLMVVIMTGLIQSNRIRSGRFRHIFFFHRTIASGFVLFAIGTFVLGVDATIGTEGIPLFGDPHGLLGAIIVVLAVLEVVPSLLAGNREKIKKLHSFVAFLILLLYCIQIVLGLEMADLIAL